MPDVPVRVLLVCVAGEEDRPSFHQLGVPAAGSQAAEAEIQEPSSPCSKSCLSQSTRALSLGWWCWQKLSQSSILMALLSWASSFPLAPRRGNPSVFCQGKASMGPSLFLCLCFLLSPSQQEGAAPDGWQPLHFSRKGRCVN